MTTGRESALWAALYAAAWGDRCHLIGTVDRTQRRDGTWDETVITHAGVATDCVRVADNDYAAARLAMEGTV